MQVKEGEALAYHILLYIFTYIITNCFTVNSQDMVVAVILTGVILLLGIACSALALLMSNGEDTGVKRRMRSGPDPGHCSPSVPVPGASRRGGHQSHRLLPEPVAMETAAENPERKLAV